MTTSGARFSRSIAYAALAIFCLESAGSARQAVPPPLSDSFDVRLSKDQAPAGYLERIAADRTAARGAALAEVRAKGVARLQSDYPSIDLVSSAILGTPEIVGTAPATGFLTGPGADRVATMRAFLSAYAEAYGVAASDVAALEVVADYQNPAGNMAWVELEQRIHGVPVFHGTIRGGFTAKGELARTTGLLASGINASALSATPSIMAPQAIFLAAASVGWDVDERQLVEKVPDTVGHATFARAGMADDAKAWLVYFPLAPGHVRLAWATQIIGDPMAYLVLVDAQDGTVLFRKSLTDFQTQSASYTIYNGDSPAPFSPATTVPGVGAQAPAIPRTTVTLIGNEGVNSFNTLGWMTDGTNLTDGNNVEAGIDVAGPNGVDAPTVGAARAFNFTYNPAPGNPPPGDVPTSASYRNGEVTNMFYWSNVYHDRLYRLGFTEVAHNFQHDNFGRGGAGGDRVSAEAQDSSGTNNANFMTPVDGSRGRLQMFVFTGPNPDRAGGLDQEIVLHELTHGTSNRLHGNATGLNTNMARGMGEGWSDFYARALLASADENVNGVYSIAGWATHLVAAGYVDNYYYGIRRFPYAVKTTVGGPGNRPHNPLTFADIDATQINLTDGAFPRGPVAVTVADQLHNVGEVWAMALFEVRARFITRLGFAAGNQRMLQFVTDGMKLDPISPTMLQGRDSIIAAAMAGGGTVADIGDIWAGFATRGMGFSAQITNIGSGANNTRVVEAFDVPGVNGTTGTVVSESLPNGRLDIGESVGVSLCMTNLGAGPSGAISATLLGGGGVLSPSGSQSFGVINPAASACRTFTFTVDGACGAVLTASLHVQDDATTKTFTYPFQIGAITHAESFDTVVAPALPAGWSTSTLAGAANLWATNATTSHTAPNHAFAADPVGISDNVLVSPAFALPPGVNRLTFRNRYNMENGFDGGVLELAVGAGAFQDILAAGGSFVSGGYNDTISPSFSSPIAGREAWTGNSGSFLTTTVNLPASAGGQNVRLRWRLGTDISVAGNGWSVDSVALGQFTCSTPPFPPTGLYASSINGNTVTLRWTAPALGPAPTSFALEGGVNPGQTLATIPTGGTTPTLTFAAPNGAFYIRARTVAGAETSAPSNEIRIFVNTPTPPSAPANLLGLVDGSALRLAWQNTFAGGAPASMALDVTGTLSASIPLGLSESFAFSGMPGGTYTFRMRATNVAGTSAPSTPVTLTFPGPCSGVPQAPANFLAYKIGSTVHVLWELPASGPAPSSYVLNVTGAFVGSFPLAGRSVSGSVGPGAYKLSVQAVNACGNGAATPVTTVTIP